MKAEYAYLNRHIVFRPFRFKEGEYWVYLFIGEKAKDDLLMDYKYFTVGIGKTYFKAFMSILYIPIENIYRKFKKLL